MADIEKYYSVTDVMNILHHSRPTVMAYIHGGLLKARKLRPDAKNSKFIIAETDLKAFIDNGVTPGYYQALYPRPHKSEHATDNN